MHSFYKRIVAQSASKELLLALFAVTEINVSLRMEDHLQIIPSKMVFAYDADDDGDEDTDTTSTTQGPKHDQRLDALGDVEIVEVEDEIETGRYRQDGVVVLELIEEL